MPTREERGEVVQAPTSKVMVNLSRSEAQGEPLSETIGPFEYVQVTYGGLHCDEDGPVFYIDPASGMWHAEKREPIPDAAPWEACGPDLSHHGWTDITIHNV